MENYAIRSHNGLSKIKMKNKKIEDSFIPKAQRIAKKRSKGTNLKFIIFVLQGKHQNKRRNSSKS